MYTCQDGRNRGEIYTQCYIKYGKTIRRILIYIIYIIYLPQTFLMWPRSAEGSCLFVITAEILRILIRNNEHIKHIWNILHRNSLQFADDTTNLLNNTRRKAYLVPSFRSISGYHIRTDTTEIKRIESKR